MGTAHLKAEGTVEYRLFDKDGNPKLIWQENWIGMVLRRYLKRDVRKPKITGSWVLVMVRRIK